MLLFINGAALVLIAKANRHMNRKIRVYIGLIELFIAILSALYYL